MICSCTKDRKLYPLKSWRVIEHRYTPKHYSRVYCLKCKNGWVARANYVSKIELLQKTLFNE